MNTNIKNSPQSEQMCLSRSAWLSIALSLMFLFNFISRLLEANNLDILAIQTVTNIAEIASFIFMVIMLVKTIQSSCEMSQSSLWFGYMEDEFLEHTNSKGYKYGFIMLLMVALFMSFGFDIFLSDFGNVSFKDMGYVCIAIGSFTYGATVLYHLKAGDDE